MKLADFIEEHQKLMMASLIGKVDEKALSDFIVHINIAIESNVAFQNRMEGLMRGWLENTDILCQLRDQILVVKGKMK